MDRITILVVEDHPLFREGVINTLNLEPDFMVVGDAPDGETGLELARSTRPDIVILDVNLPTINGHQVTHQLMVERIPTKVVFLTAYDEVEQILQAMRSGARAYCAKDIKPDHLVKVIRWVASGNYVVGEHFFTQEELNEWLRGYGEYYEPDQDRVWSQTSPLSSREMEVLICVTQGLSNKEIAQKLCISHQTVKNHITSILRKLGVDDRTQAAVHAIKMGWVSMSHSSKNSDSSNF